MFRCMSVREGEDLPYGDWLRAGVYRPREQPRKDTPSPPRRQPTNQQPPRKTDAPTATPTRIETIELLDNNDGVTDSMMALNVSNGHGMSKPTIMGDINPDIMEGITLAVGKLMGEINLDSNEVSKRKELNRNKQNIELKAEGFINVPIACMGNMVNSGKKFQRETLAKQATDRKSRDSTQTTRPKTPKWTKIVREVSASNTTPTGKVETGKKKSTGGGNARWL